MDNTIRHRSGVIEERGGFNDESFEAELLAIAHSSSMIHGHWKQP
jgi:hypothetical protein